MIPELADDVSAQKRQALRNQPALWVRNGLKHPVDPSRDYDFKTENGTPLTHILHEDSWVHPDNWGDINVLLLARGELKSTSTGWLEAWAHDAFPQFHSYIIAPSKDQIIDFVEPIRQTYVEQANMDNRRVTDNKTNQVWKTYRKDESGNVNPVMGRLQTDSGYSEKSVRGKHSQMGITDETQDLSQRVFNVFLPSIDQGLPTVDWFPTVFCIGTPKETGSFYHDLWERSDKRTWDGEAQEWVTQSEVDPYTLSAEELQQLPGNHDIDDIEEEYTVRGWHVDWINSPLHSMADVARAQKQMGEMEFANEVLAKFYDPEDNLLSESDIESCFNTDYNYRETPYNRDNHTVVVADWGGGQDDNASDTIFVAAEEIPYENDDNEYVILNVRYLDPNQRNRQQIREYEKWVKQFDADCGLVDYGFGEQAMESLQHGDDTIEPDGYMDTVSAVHYGTVKNRTDIKWVTDDNDNNLFFTCDKSRTATRMVETVRDQQWVLPRATDNSSGLSMRTSDDDGTRLREQLTAPYKTLSETKTSNKRVYIETPGNQRDDAFDAFCFCWLAMQEVRETDDHITTFATNSKPGVAQ